MALGNIGKDGKPLGHIDVVLEELSLVGRRLVLRLELEHLGRVEVPVVLLEGPVRVAEEAVVALHAHHVVVVLPAVSCLEDTPQFLSCRARELVGAVGKRAVDAVSALGGLKPVLADLRLVAG